jgi:phosphoglycerol transferase MdoB-like AlkP superfamily enzyme
VRIQFNRLKRIVWTIENFICDIKDLERFANPFASYLYYTFLIVVIVFMDMDYLLHYVLAILIVVMLYCHPLFGSYLREVIEYLNIVNKYHALKSKLSDKSKNTFLGEYFDPTGK